VRRQRFLSVRCDLDESLLRFRLNHANICAADFGRFLQDSPGGFSCGSFWSLVSVSSFQLEDALEYILYSSYVCRTQRYVAHIIVLPKKIYYTTSTRGRDSFLEEGINLSTMDPDGPYLYFTSRSSAVHRPAKLEKLRARRWRRARGRFEILSATVGGWCAPRAFSL
jgi:hypothetical protein